MLTPKQKENILTIMANKRKDIVYRDWARLVRGHLSELVVAGDKVMNKQIRTVITNLKDLESFYMRRITKRSAKSIARDFSCKDKTVYRIEKEARTGVSEFHLKKLRKEERKLVGSRL